MCGPAPRRRLVRARPVVLSRGDVEARPRHITLFPGSFSSVSKRNFASKYAFFSIFQNLQNYLAEFSKSCKILQKNQRCLAKIRKFSKKLQNFVKFREILRLIKDCSHLASPARSPLIFHFFPSAHFLFFSPSRPSRPRPSRPSRNHGSSSRNIFPGIQQPAMSYFPFFPKSASSIP